ncbi:MAG: class I SAM-dependent methyltransferase [Nitrososphaera sp.]|nr:class I SAM-dependent methyltransferase [Nitrososphaera sp.]
MNSHPGGQHSNERIGYSQYESGADKRGQESALDLQSAVADAHNAMADEYDLIEDLWYSWLFFEIHAFIVQHLPKGQGRTAIDVGCGTGFQSFLLAAAGYKVDAFDIAEDLVNVACRKAEELPTRSFAELVTSLGKYGIHTKQRERLRLRLNGLSVGGPIHQPRFYIADAVDPTAYGSGMRDVITCCGSVVSFIPDYEKVLEQMSRVLSPGGLLFLEVEQRYNFDLFWPVIDRLIGGRLEYGQTFSETLRILFSNPLQEVILRYPFQLKSGEWVDLPIRLFTPLELKRSFRRFHLTCRAVKGIHVWTNLIPSTVLHRPHPAVRLQNLFTILGKVDRFVSTHWPFYNLGCSIVYCLEKS